MKKIIILGSVFFMFPMMSFAQFGKVDDFFNNIGTFINNVLIPLIFAFALLFFIYGMFRYFILGGANDDSREKGKKVMVWSIIGLVLAVSIWGIVNILASGLFGTNNAAPRTPTGPGFQSMYIQSLPLALYRGDISTS